MTKNLSRIDRLKWAIDTLTTISQALVILQKEGIITQDETIEKELLKARTKLAQLKQEK